MKEIKLKVNGMVCGGCENAVKNALERINGVKKVEANHNTCEVKVFLTDDIEKEKLEDVISDLGYEVVKE